MTDIELDRFFQRVRDESAMIVHHLEETRQASQNGRKQKLSYITKKLDIIGKTCELAQERLRN